MTQQQLVQEFKNYPKAQKLVVISQLLRILADDLEEIPQQMAAKFLLKRGKPLSKVYTALPSKAKLRRPMKKSKEKENFSKLC